VDPTTLHAYSTHAAEIARRHAAARSGIARYFPLAFPDPHSRILDVGAGGGRDLAELVSEGYVAYGMEPVEAMRAEAVRSHPQLDGLLFEGSLPDVRLEDLRLPGAETAAPFDGVLCSAVLQHLPRPALFDAVFSLRRLLRPGGRVLVSIPVERRGLDADGRDAFGRLFNGVQPGELDLLFERVGFRTLGRWQGGDGLDRDDVRWATLLFELAHAEDVASPRPLDRIEAVLRRDRKTATYKLALLRALADIATSQSRRVRWRPDGRVAVPLAAVAELWIEYYWPLFASRTFLPQMSGEAGQSQHRLGFARELRALMNRFDQSGGLRGFLTSQRSGQLAATTARLHAQLLSKLGQTIRTGPVHHAGLSTSGALFSYEAASKCILVDEALWREIALMSHWLRDSLLVRWAEQSAGLARSAGGDEAPAPGRVLERALHVLLTPALSERDTQDARRVYAALPARRCTWTARPLPGAFEVDHVIPFSLWQSNDLWNLLPASRSANNAKRDRLPERRLLRAQRPLVLDAWQQLRASLPTRFDVELEHLTGQPHPDLEAGFDALCEAVEVTALQRGCERWAP